MNHRAAAIRSHTTAILRAAAQYRRENHCRCGAWVPFATHYLEGRRCESCKTGAEG